MSDDDIVTELTCEQCGLVGRWGWKHKPVDTLKQVHETQHPGHKCKVDYTTQREVVQREMATVKGKVCKRCGHEACPFCKEWCDVVLYKPDDVGYHDPEALKEEIIDEDGKVKVIDNDDPYPILCCAGECVYE